MKVTEFITARLDEDEAIASAATPGPWVTAVRTVGDQGVITDLTYPPGSGYVMTQPVMSNDEAHHRQNAEHIARHDPARVRCEVAAKRRMVEDTWGGPDHEDMWLHHMRLLAAVWSDHPDYQQKWAL